MIRRSRSLPATQNVSRLISPSGPYSELALSAASQHTDLSLLLHDLRLSGSITHVFLSSQPCSTRACTAAAGSDCKPAAQDHLLSRCRRALSVLHPTTTTSGTQVGLQQYPPGQLSPQPPPSSRKHSSNRRHRGAGVLFLAAGEKSSKPRRFRQSVRQSCGRCWRWSRKVSVGRAQACLLLAPAARTSLFPPQPLCVLCRALHESLPLSLGLSLHSPCSAARGDLQCPLVRPLQDHGAAVGEPDENSGTSGYQSCED